MAKDNSRSARKSTRLEDLAKRAGVSISTVSRALNDSPAINRRTKQAIWELARELDYPFRQRMPAGPIGAEATIAVVVPQPQARDGHIYDPFFFDLLAGVVEAARERNCDVLVSHITPTTYEDLAFAMSTSRADGVIFIGQSSLHVEFNRLAAKDSRFVVWGAELPEQSYCSIGSDNTMGGRRATSHLARLGREKILFLGDTEAPEAMQRYRGYLEGLERAGIEAQPDWYLPVHFEVESAEAAIHSLIEKGTPFDGIVAASDLIALGAIRAIQASGRSVPDDVSVVGYDNVPFSKLTKPSLTTISQDTEKAGRLLVSKLIDSQGGSRRSERSPTDLIVRESCGA
ncbi:LacI family DNA-binding transcriptional regulator [Henriciella aquimarina]|uniref:LacI family DNA-binding transcriptional regulator n=1 Tax=Henriciella aquimarina TaxID=545261 RepID=UPI000A000E6C|nr:LacI family DNA-binding transcriptional regulator [Henriciella aquimarina]